MDIAYGYDTIRHIDVIKPENPGNKYVMDSGKKKKSV